MRCCECTCPSGDRSLEEVQLGLGLQNSGLGNSGEEIRGIHLYAFELPLHDGNCEDVITDGRVPSRTFNHDHDQGQG